MIKVENLTKQYGEGKDCVNALNGVSFTLPNKGMIFIIGKSGSGKSTLLNLLGGLDDITSGDIIINGESLKSFSEANLNIYHSQYVGIIYQNFNLFDGETVHQNILDASEICKGYEADESIIDSTLEKLDILKKKHILVKNLSGGQKQRVAIARALIKNPKMILADEPTGNLDSKSSKAVFDILKEISQERLVVVISHDNASAEQYADRIISISDGLIYNDSSRDENYIEPAKNTLLLEKDSTLKQEDIEEINNYISKFDLSVSKKQTKFSDTIDKEIDYIPGNLKTTKQKFNLKSNLRITNRFIRSSIASFMVLAFVIALMVSLLSLSEQFVNFDSAGAISAVGQKYNANAYIANKAYSFYDDPSEINKDYLIDITDNDVKYFRDNGYSGNIYHIYNTSLFTIDFWNNFNCCSSDTYWLYQNLYAGCTRGTLVCDLNYLEKTFGNIEVLAGSIYDCQYDSTKLIVTDYYADSYIEMKKLYGDPSFVSDDPNDPYQKIVNTTLWEFMSYQIGAVIKTDYKTKYQNLFNQYKRVYSEPQNAHEIVMQIARSEDFITFTSECDARLNLTYSIRPTFYEDSIKNSYYHVAVCQNISLNDVVTNDTLATFNLKYFYENNSLKTGEIILNSDYAKQYFESIGLTDVDLNDYVNNLYFNYESRSFEKDSTDAPNYSVKLKVVGFAESNDLNWIGSVCSETFKTALKESFFDYSLLFDNLNDAFKVYQASKDAYFYTPIKIYQSVINICNIVDIFSDIFILIATFLLAMVAVLLVSNNLRMIKKNNYNIGVYRSIGYSIGSLTQAFALSIILLVIIMFVFSIIITACASGGVNYLLIQAFSKYQQNTFIASLTLIDFNILSLLWYAAMILFVGLLTTLIPLFKIKKTKAIVIINKVSR